MASGMRNMMMELVYKIRKCLVVNIKAGRGEIDSFCFFAAPLPYLCRILQICGSSLMLCGRHPFML